MAPDVGIAAGTPYPRIRRLITAAAVGMAAVTLSVSAAQTDIMGPPGSGAFGASVTVLPSGNIVVTDPNAGMSNVGAVYLYSPTGVPISSLQGSSANDQVGGGGITVLANGHFVVASPQWDDGGLANVGAVTWVNGDSGLTGTVSAANSLVGSAAGDSVGSGGVTALSNGNYVVASPQWDNGATQDVGAATWANGATGLSGAVSTANSLVGRVAGDQVANSGVTGLGNGHYVVVSTLWNNGVNTDVGAVTWGNGTTVFSDRVEPRNSLRGTTVGDQIGSGGITVLSNGNYVVSSPLWDNGPAVDAGAATWRGGGSAGVAGAVSASNSLVGTSSGDQVGNRPAVALSNGNYVVASPQWDNGATQNVGAATWADGTAGLSGAVSAANSLIGTAPGDAVGNLGVTALSNGNYVVASPQWDNGATQDVGAATWANGSTGLSGSVSPGNSLIGTTANDRVAANGATALSNGNYVVRSPLWNNGATALAGAATWGNGSAGLSGTVSAANSLVGTTAADVVGNFGVTGLSNGHYVVVSAHWDNGFAADAGAVTWGNGTTGISGAVSTANSLVGTSSFDQVGNGPLGASEVQGVTRLSNGNYVVSSRDWDNGPSANAGAVTWGNGSVGLTGAVSAANSLIGSTADDAVGSDGVTALSAGHYAFRSPDWDSAMFTNAGAVTLARGTSALTGAILPGNSVLGTAAGGGASMVFDYDAAREQLVVGRPASNIVSLFTLPPDLVFADGFE